MALNTSGPISLAGTITGQSIEIELGGSGSSTISLNDTNVRTLAGVPSGAITMPTNFYGKSSTITASYTFTSNTQDYTLDVTLIPGYVAGKTVVTITVASGVYIWASSTGTPALTIIGGTSGDTITLINNGYIMGKGGNGGGVNTSSQYVFTPTAGGPALSLGFNTTIDNTNPGAYIGGGGGGAGGTGGGGAGGGNGGQTGAQAGGAGGGIGASGNRGNGTGSTFGGGGGGRVFPGAGGGASFGGGAGGGGGGNPYQQAGAGGSSNGGGQSNQSSSAVIINGGGGGGWGASGGSGSTNGTGRGGAGGGKAINLNGYSVTFVNGDTSRVWGGVS